MAALPLYQTVISGKVTRVSTSDDGHVYTTVILPAPDPYSKPPIVKIRSKRRVGVIDSEINELVCRISGYERSFRYPDKKTGQMTLGYNVEMFLDLAE
ncbi:MULTISPECIES: DNA-binding protein G5P [unclassified Arsenophonus]|uniref:DNA-binding protein G5P n=2 Tax=Arsenophonus TaxID=637 RepID=UPI0028545AA9|nr:DNA-binding protein G5P [Arsenophonus sp.]MDR5615432.1 DNA-binding protein G5P [Arsenophonus sp.]